MECPRGSGCTESEHQVSTASKAREWYPDVLSAHLPVTVKQFKSGNGRLMIKIIDKDGHTLHRRG